MKSIYSTYESIRKCNGSASTVLMENCMIVHLDPLATETRQLIKEAIEQTKPTTTVNNIQTSINNIELIYRIDGIAEDLEFIRQYLVKNSC